VYQASVRSATAGTGKTILALFAVLSLLLSALAMATPAAATHDGGFDHQPLPIDTSTFAHDADDCEDVDLEAGQVLLHWIANQQNTTASIQLTLHLQGGGSMTLDSHKWNTPANINSNVTHHFEAVLDGDVVITDLELSTDEGNVRLSHVCRVTGDGVADDAGILIQKEDEDGARLAGAVFTVEGVSGEFTTGANGRVCVDGLPQGATLLVTEIQAPAGYRLADPASQLVEVDEDGCDSSADVRFVNLLDDEGVADDAGILIQKEDEDGARLAGAVFTVEGVSGEFTTGANGRVCVDGLPQGATLLVTEIQAPAGYRLADPASQLVEVDEDGCDSSPDVRFINLLDEVEMVEVMIMKHNCANVTSMAEFEEVEARAATNPTTPDAPFGPTVETVLECPTVVLPGDEQTTGTVAGGESTFEFTVAHAGGTATLSTDGTFEALAACETDVMYDADRSGELDADVCLDLSHYSFEVSAEGQVTITETAAPDGLAFGALRFDPGSQDAESLVSAEGGVIVLNPSVAEDGMIMLHVYNFAVADGEGEGPGVQQPGEGELPGGPQVGEGTLPDTAIPVTGAAPAGLLALVMLTGLGAAGYAMQAEARRRR
jgi:hypothetical protein